MKAIDTKPIESAINNHIITSNSTTHNTTTQFTGEVRDVVTLNNPPPINVTYTGVSHLRKKC